jgi:hypothetical protein
MDVNIIGQHMRSEMHWYNWVIIGLSAFNVYMIYRAYQIQGALNQSLLDNQIAIAMLSAMKDEIENSSMFKDETNEGFVKFLSDSREWAFKYIEDTIAIVNNVIEDCRKEMNNTRVDDLNTPTFLSGVIGKLLPIVQDNGKSSDDK